MVRLQPDATRHFLLIFASRNVSEYFLQDMEFSLALPLPPDVEFETCGQPQFPRALLCWARTSSARAHCLLFFASSPCRRVRVSSEHHTLNCASGCTRDSGAIDRDRLFGEQYEERRRHEERSADAAMAARLVPTSVTRRAGAPAPSTAAAPTASPPGLRRGFLLGDTRGGGRPPLASASAAAASDNLFSAVSAVRATRSTVGAGGMHTREPRPMTVGDDVPGTAEPPARVPIDEEVPLSLASLFEEPATAPRAAWRASEHRRLGALFAEMLSETHLLPTSPAHALAAFHDDLGEQGRLLYSESEPRAAGTSAAAPPPPPPPDDLSSAVSAVRTTRSTVNAGGMRTREHRSLYGLIGPAVGDLRDEVPGGALYGAACAGDVQAVRTLLADWHIPHACCVDAMGGAAVFGQPEVVRMLTAYNMEENGLPQRPAVPTRRGGVSTASSSAASSSGSLPSTAGSSSEGNRAPVGMPVGVFVGTSMGPPLTQGCLNELLWGRPRAAAVPTSAGSSSAGSSSAEAAQEDPAHFVCCVCLDARNTHLFVPCMHMCACRDCAAVVMASTALCPVCRRVATAVAAPINSGHYNGPPPHLGERTTS